MLAYQARHEHHCSGCVAQLLSLLKYSTIQSPRSLIATSFRGSYAKHYQKKTQQNNY